MRMRASVVGAFVAMAGFSLAHGELISANPAGFALPGASIQPTISADARVVAFASGARLNAEDQNGQFDIYAHSRLLPLAEMQHISDSRGGDMPLISPSGKYILYRSRERFPKLRLANFDLPGAPLTVTIPDFDGGSFRFSDTGQISFDGQYVAYSSKPVPGLANKKFSQLTLRDTFNGNGLNGTSGIFPNPFNQNNPPKTMNRVARTPGGIFYFETFDQLAPEDQDVDRQDIYQVAADGSNLVRITTPQDGLVDEKKACYDLALNSDGSSVFFISNKRLRMSDTDHRATIYRYSSAGLEPLPTAVLPLALSRQAVGNGEYVVFIGVSSNGAPGQFILKTTAPMQVKPLVSGSLAFGAPAISANNAFIAVSTAAALDAKDRNGTADIYLLPNPFPDAPLPPPTLSFTTNATGADVIANGTFRVDATATPAAGKTIRYIGVEVDGFEQIHQGGSSFTNVALVLGVGAHTIQATTMDSDDVVTRAPPVNVFARPSNNMLALARVKDLVRQTVSFTGAVTFSGTVSIINTSFGGRGPVRVVMTEAPQEYTASGFGSGDMPSTRTERVLEVIEVPTAEGKGFQLYGSTSRTIAGVTLPPELRGPFHFSGTGSNIVLKLQERTGTSPNFTWTLLDTQPLFSTVPQLNEDTPGANGGASMSGDSGEDSTFNPPQLLSVDVANIPRVAELTRRQFFATATFDAGSPAIKPCAPVWSLAGNAGLPISINPSSGVLTVGNLAVRRTVQVMATLGQGGVAKTGMLPVEVVPVSPVVAVRALTPVVNEPTGHGIFRFLRSQISGDPLDVPYTLSGKATVDAGSGPDSTLTTTPSIATIPAGASFVDLPFDVTSDISFEGNESLRIDLTPNAGEYRLNAATNHATVTIAEDQQVPDDQPDGTLRAGAGAVIGAKVYDFDALNTSQRAVVNGGANVPAIFTYTVVNRATVAQAETITGGGDFEGFVVRYLDGAANVTAQVTGAGLTVNVNPGRAHALRVVITPTATATVQSSIECPIQAQGNNGSIDIVQALVRRVR